MLVAAAAAAALALGGLARVPAHESDAAQDELQLWGLNHSVGGMRLVTIASSSGSGAVRAAAAPSSTRHKTDQTSSIVAPNRGGQRRVRWFTNADQVEANWAFAQQNRSVVTGFYPCCGVLGGTANGSLQLASATPEAAMNLSQPYRALGYSVHPVIGLNDAASLEAAAAPNSTFAADAVAISERYNFSVRPHVHFRPATAIV